MHRTKMNATEARKATGRPHWDNGVLQLGTSPPDEAPREMEFTLQIRHHTFDHCI